MKLSNEGTRKWWVA